MQGYAYSTAHQSILPVCSCCYFRVRGANSSHRNQANSSSSGTSSDTLLCTPRASTEAFAIPCLPPVSYLVTAAGAVRHGTTSMPFGQLVIGPPGSGKTTYCNGVSQYLRALGRKVVLVNLDPANDVLPYTPDVDVGELVDLAAVQDSLGLGPNGGMLYCMEYLASNLDWLQEQLDTHTAGGAAYFIFDCPGQVELFTGQEAFKQVLTALTEAWHYRLAVVHLVDAHLATDASKYLSALLLALSTMLHLELPQVNVLSKVDLVPQYGQLAFNLEYYTQVQDLSYLVASMGRGPFSQRFRRLSAGLADVIEGYSLVGFTPLAIQDQASLSRLVGQVDKANGACYARLDAPPVPVPAELLAASGHTAAEDDLDADLQERYIDSSSSSSSSSSRRRRGGGVGQQQQQQGVAAAAVPGPGAESLAGRVVERDVDNSG